MKKGIKLGLISAITLLSGTAMTAQATTTSTSAFVEDICSYVPLACSVGTMGNGSGFEPPVPGENTKDKK